MSEICTRFLNSLLVVLKAVLKRFFNGFKISGIQVSWSHFCHAVDAGVVPINEPLEDINKCAIVMLKNQRFYHSFYCPVESL